MDPVVIQILIQLSTYGPLGIMAVLSFWLFIQERRKTSELTSKLIEYAKASIEADVEHTKGWGALGNLYELGLKTTEINIKTIEELSVVKDSIRKVDDELRRNHGSKD
jgi:hypothetical protein